MTSSHETIQENNRPTDLSLHQKTIAPVAKQALIIHKFTTHHPKAGLNPLVDAAAHLFSVMGKLKQLKTSPNLVKLHQELSEEINTFQDTVKSLGYSSEYVLVSRYLVCAALDDIIDNTSWGTQERWGTHSLLTAFNQEAQPERFFMILERANKDPALYIDVMEFIYICLSLGFKGIYRSTEYNNSQLEQITHSLYKNIRHTRGDFSKMLSPFPLKAVSTHKAKSTNMPIWLIIVLTITAIALLFIGSAKVLDMISNQAYQELTYIGKSILYETHEP